MLKARDLPASGRNKGSEKGHSCIEMGAVLHRFCMESAHSGSISCHFSDPFAGGGVVDSEAGSLRDLHWIPACAGMTAGGVLKASFLPADGRNKRSEMGRSCIEMGALLHWCCMDGAHFGAVSRHFSNVVGLNPGDLSGRNWVAAVESSSPQIAREFCGRSKATYHSHPIKIATA